MKSLINIYNPRAKSIECPTPIINRVTSMPLEITTLVAFVHTIQSVGFILRRSIYIPTNIRTNSNLFMLLYGFCAPFGNHALLYSSQKY